MAGQPGLKAFYIGAGAVVVAGVAGIWWARQSASSAGQVRDIDPLPVAAGSFEGYVMGSDSAPVEVIEYADFECPACAQFAILTVPDAKERLVATGRVRWVFRDFPLDNHRNAMPAHLAASCAGEQGRFWAMHDQLYFRHREWVGERRPERRFEDYAEAMGLDMDRYDECMDSQRHAGRILAAKQQGIEQGVGSTPTLIVNNRLIPGAIGYDSLRALVDQAGGSAQ